MRETKIVHIRLWWGWNNGKKEVGTCIHRQEWESVSVRWGYSWRISWGSWENLQRDREETPIGERTKIEPGLSLFLRKFARAVLRNRLVFVSLDLQMYIWVILRMRRVSNYFSEEKNARYYVETWRLGLRLCRGLFSNSLGLRIPLFCGHKLTYNCTLRCEEWR